MTNRTDLTHAWTAFSVGDPISDEDLGLMIEEIEGVIHHVLSRQSTFGRITLSALRADHMRLVDFRNARNPR